MKSEVQLDRMNKHDLFSYNCATVIEVATLFSRVVVVAAITAIIACKTQSHSSLGNLATHHCGSCGQQYLRPV